ncbi:hypothetical protein [Corynebacterium antarcticum]|uniref:hypothetical protein n=1 Tax=Corynebacterium antarcticum TaxID=2800405 RepID=UPI002260DDA0|nr:hypothetical protein [Corynebacterium antarcticum]MCX7540524.1 hypothetical protein [Corynebacterium antarcticum]
MMKTLSALGFSRMYHPGRQRTMVTLTYPEDRWKELLPNGEVTVEHLGRFLRKFEDAFGETPTLIWVREFTKNGSRTSTCSFSRPPDE